MRIFRPCLGLILIIYAAFGPANLAVAKEKPKNDEPPKQENKPFETLIKDSVKIDGLFTFYVKSDDGKVFMEIKPFQYDSTYLSGMTRSSGDGTFFDNGADMGDFPFKFKRVGQTMQMVAINVRFRADSAATLNRAIDRGVSHSLFGVAKIESQPR